MKCPNCSTVNGKTNKYCRQCGAQLKLLAASEPQLAPASTNDEVGLGEELFAVLELFEHCSLDAALEKAEKLASANPNSASAHSIVALAYERKAENALSEENADAARDFLKRAMQHYEAIIDLNPDSAADREKLASLRLRYSGRDSNLDAKVSFGPDVIIKRRVLEKLQSVPKPALAGGATFVVIVVLVVIATSLSGGSKTSRASKPYNKPIVSITQPRPNQPALRVYTFPRAQNNSSTSTAPPTPAAVQKAANHPAKPPQSFTEIKPLNVPKINQELTLVPESKSVSTKSEPTQTKHVEKPAEKNIAASYKPTGDSMLANAVRLHNQGVYSEAIGAANQAIVIYRADVDAGKNVDRANRGIATATKYISLWRSNSSE